MQKELQGQAALVTGASRGIGRAAALALARAGAAVAVGYRSSQAEAEAVVRAVQEDGGTALSLAADVTDAAACREAVARTTGTFGRLDILVNNAGTSLEKLFLDTTLAEWEEQMAVHLRSTYACTHAALPGMIERRFGRIINISSIWGMVGASGEVAYSAAKAGQIGFTKALAQEVGGLGITVNAVAPGAIETDMNAGLTGPDLERWLARTPAGRLGTADEVADIILFLAGPRSGFVTGQVWSPNGGVVV